MCPRQLGGPGRSAWLAPSPRLLDITLSVHGASSSSCPKRSSGLPREEGPAAASRPLASHSAAAPAGLKVSGGSCGLRAPPADPNRLPRKTRPPCSPAVMPAASHWLVRASSPVHAPPSSTPLSLPSQPKCSTHFAPNTRMPARPALVCNRWAPRQGGTSPTSHPRRCSRLFGGFGAVAPLAPPAFAATMSVRLCQPPTPTRLQHTSPRSSGF